MHIRSFSNRRITNITMTMTRMTICVLFSCCAVLPRLDTAPGFVANGETWIKIRWLRWNGVIEKPLSLLYQIEYQASDSSEGAVWLLGPLVPHDGLSGSTSTEYIEAVVSGLTRNTFYDFRVQPMLRGANDSTTNASASHPSSPYRTRCSGV